MGSPRLRRALFGLAFSPFVLASAALPAQLVSHRDPRVVSPSLRQQIEEIAAESKGKVSVACSLPGTSLTCDLNPHARPPMQSVFKLPLAMAILHQVEAGKFSLDQPIHFLPADRIPHAYSPLQDKYPAADVDVPLRELLSLAVSLSDNAAADILLRIAGGTRPVNDYIASIGVHGFQLLDGEQELHRDQALQYRNWLEPAGALELLSIIDRHSVLTAEHCALILDWMTSNRTLRIMRELPAGTVVAHKSGTSDVTNGLAHATNDIGLITLPDGRKLAIAVFLTDSTADDTTRDKIIGRIALAAYLAAIHTH